MGGDQRMIPDVFPSYVLRQDLSLNLGPAGGLDWLAVALKGLKAAMSSF